MISKELFGGVDGYLGLELYGKDNDKAGVVVPEFFSQAGEKIEIPAQFEAVVHAVTLGVWCCGSPILISSYPLRPVLLQPLPANSVASPDVSTAITLVCSACAFFLFQSVLWLPS
jgi:hypothetical protein